MKRYTLTLLLAYIFFSLPQQAKAIDYTLVGALNITQMNETSSAGSVKGDGLASYGAGLLLDFNIYNSVNFQTGLIYLDRKFGFETDEFSGASLQSPLLIKVILSPQFYFSLGLALDFKMGDVSRNTSGVSSIDTSFTSLNYGGELAFGWKYPISWGSIVLEANYLSDLSNRSDTSGIERSFTEYRLLIGLELGGSNGLGAGSPPPSTY